VSGIEYFQMSTPTLADRRTAVSDRRVPVRKSSAYVKLAVGGALALAAAALVNRQLAKRAELNHPPAGHFLEIDGVRLHYVERGSGPALLLLHGNGTMVDDFESSGLLDLAAREYRVVAFDRPGFGHSSRPSTVVWTPEAQAEIIHKAMERLGLSHAVVLGHSWGASVAIALALEFPKVVGALVLASGYYYPSARLDALMMSPPAVPGVGAVLSHTLAPMIGRLTWPLLTKQLFGPEGVPAKFAAFPKEMALRPSQIRASAGEAALMVPDAILFRKQYGRLKMPVAIIAGTGDRVVDIEEQSARLHREIPQSRFYRIEGSGHMVHQSATEAVMSAINDAAVALKVCPQPSTP
jgi:pimeloyl-ACP methyl ester carboxylesterase